jgi:hypothetical protein
MTEVRCWRDQAACLEVVTADYDPFFADAKDSRLRRSPSARRARCGMPA